MQNEKTSSMTSCPSMNDNGGFRAKADEYNRIINAYVMRISFVKESNLKMKRSEF